MMIISTRKKPMGPRRRRHAPGRPSSSPPPVLCELPMDVLLEIALRAGFVALLRCGATCRSLRRAIHGPDIARRVREGMVLPPSRLLGLLDTTGTSSFSLVHPSTTTAASLVDDQLAPFVSRASANLLTEYSPVMSHGGLILLERKASVVHGRRRRRSSLERQPPDICVYDPMTGGRTFLPFPPDITRATYVLLTAADGMIGGSFLLLAFDTWRLEDLLPLRVQTVSSDADGKWAPMEYSYHPDLPKGSFLGSGNLPVVVDGVVHWLISSTDHILTYDVGTSAVGSIGLPKDGLLLPVDWRASESCLGSTPDGRLTLVYRHGFRVSILVLSAGGGWERHMEVDTTAMVLSLMVPQERYIWLELVGSGDQRTGAVLIRLNALVGPDHLLMLDVETKEIRLLGDRCDIIPYEVDLMSRLSTAKIF